jgi:hypothetical protein
VCVCVCVCVCNYDLQLGDGGSTVFDHYLVKLGTNADPAAVALNVMKSIITPTIERDIKAQEEGKTIKVIPLLQGVPTAKKAPVASKKKRGKKQTGPVLPPIAKDVESGGGDEETAERMQTDQDQDFEEPVPEPEPETDQEKAVPGVPYGPQPRRYYHIS